MFDPLFISGFASYSSYNTLINTVLNKHDFFLSFSSLLIPHDLAQNARSLVRHSPFSLGKTNESLCPCAPTALGMNPAPVTNWVVSSLFTYLL